MCSVVDSNSHSDPRSKVDVGSTLTSILPLAQWSHILCCYSSRLDRVGKKLSVKADLVIYNYIVTVSGQYLSVTIILNGLVIVTI